MNSFESKIVETIQRIGTPELDWFFKIITILGEFGIVLVFVAVILVFFGAKKAAKYIAITGAATLAGIILKSVFQRPRPFNYNSAIVDKVAADGFSFVSGHTIITAVTAIFLALCILKAVHSKWARILIVMFFAFMVLLVGFSRVYLGVHYISDVLGAIVLAAIVYGVISIIFEKCFKYFVRNVQK